MHGWMKERNVGKCQVTNPDYARVSDKMVRLRKKLANMKDTATVEELTAIGEEIVSLKRQQLAIPSKDPMDTRYRRFRYCRYADDFLIGVIGSKRDAEEMMAAVRSHVQGLKLEVSDEEERHRPFV